MKTSVRIQDTTHLIPVEFSFERCHRRHVAHLRTKHQWQKQNKKISEERITRKDGWK